MPEPPDIVFREISGSFFGISLAGCGRRCCAWLVTTGAQLAEAFHRDVVGPLLATTFPTLRYAAARLGSGSDVLGYDDAMSRDHDWGCRLTVLVDSDDLPAVPLVQEALANSLPESYDGHPVRFPVTWDQEHTHNVQVATVSDFALSRLGVRPPLDAIDWLVPSGQGVLEIVGGPVFVDETRELAPLREALRWYPADVDRFVLASAWNEVGERLQMVGRTGQRGHDLQSHLLTGQIVGSLVYLAFLVHRQWMPYAKWREARLRTLPDADRLCDLFAAALDASHWSAREQAIVEVAELLLDVQRDRGLESPSSAVVAFFGRPFRTVNDSVVRLLLDGVADERLRRLPLVGGADFWIDSDRVLSNPELRAASSAAYGAWLA
jgi:uncharacterized protein DUF4037